MKRVLIRRKNANVSVVKKEKSPIVKQLNKEAAIFDRQATPSPTRGKLTKKEWAEWGEGLRRLRNLGYSNPSRLSLIEMREALELEEQNALQRAFESCKN